jgi:micrococcal nuclease
MRTRQQGTVARLAIGVCAIALSVVCLTSSEAAARPVTFSGPVHVVDGDTLVVNGVSVRLKGVDAMERGTPEGDAATAAMRGLVRDGERVTCKVTGEKTRRREVGYCFRGHDRLDINRAIVAAGVALGCPHYDPRYVEVETRDARQRLQQASYCAELEASCRPGTDACDDIFAPSDEAEALESPQLSGARQGIASSHRTYVRHGRKGCGSRGGPGYRLPNGKCASWSD